MPIFRRIADDTPRHSNVMALTDVPGHEAGRFVHGGSCPLRGQTQVGGSLGPMCSDSCSGPTPPVLIEVLFHGVVLSTDGNHATIWDFLSKTPRKVPLPDDPVYPARAEVDASAGLHRLHDEWALYRELEDEARRKVREQAEQERSARIKADEDRKAQAKAAKAAKAALEEEARQRKLASRIRRGSRLRIIEDPPGFAEAQRRIKPKNRTPSLIGTEGWCDHVDTYADPYIFMRLEGQPAIRVLRACVRVVFPDGTLGEEDLLPERAPTKK